MSHNSNNAYNDFSAVSINNYKSDDLRTQSAFFKFLVLNTFIVLLLLITILYPFKFFKKIVVKFFCIKLPLVKLNIYHILLLLIGIYTFLYFCLKLKVEEFDYKDDTYAQKMLKLNEKWVIESEIWMVFLIIISLLSIYRNANLFNREIQNEEKIIKINEEINKMNKNKKN